MKVENQTPIRWNRIFAVLLLLAVLLELGSQFFFLRWAGKEYRSTRVNIWSPYGLVRNNPQITSPEYDINSNGFRNTTVFTKKKPRDTCRILILGASVMYSGLGGWFPPDTQRVGTDKTIAQYLEKILREDPLMQGIGIEVINAAVNFNRINETSASYLEEYTFWDPDIVIVGGSANNFVIEPPLRGEIEKGSYNLLGFHPWRIEFERQVNNLGFGALAERAVLTLESKFASPALMRKLTSRFNDIITERSIALGRRVKSRFDIGSDSATTNRAAKEDRFATKPEYDRYTDAYLSFFSAMNASAKARDQTMAFFWEYYLVQLKGIKTFTPAETLLYNRNLEGRPLIGPLNYNLQARDRIQEYCQKHDVSFIDPLQELRTCRESVFIDYLHYTPSGNSFMAGVMYDRLKGQLHSCADRIRQTKKGK